MPSYFKACLSIGIALSSLDFEPSLEYIGLTGAFVESTLADSLSPRRANTVCFSAEPETYSTLHKILYIWLVREEICFVDLLLSQNASLAW